MSGRPDLSGEKVFNENHKLGKGFGLSNYTWCCEKSFIYINIIRVRQRIFEIKFLITNKNTSVYTRCSKKPQYTQICALKKNYC